MVLHCANNVFYSSVKSINPTNCAALNFFKFFLRPSSNQGKLIQVCSVTTSPITSEEKLKSHYDVIVVGGGHNGLVSAAYLAQKGFSVGLFERRHLLGGAAVTEEIVPGYQFSRASYVLSLLRPVVIKELELQKYGLEAYIRTSPSFTPMLETGINGSPPRSLLFSNDSSVTYDEISKFSEKDAKAYGLYRTKIEKMAAAVKPLIDAQLPSTGLPFLKNIESLQPILSCLTRLGLEDIPSFYELVTAPISKVLGRWFESEPLKATLAVDGVIGAMLSPETPGSGYVLLHHIMGEWNGVQDTWCFVKGGMGSVSNAIARSASDKGAHLFASQEVSEITCEADRCDGVVLRDGRHVTGTVIISNATPHVTFEKLVPSASRPIDERSSEYFKHIAKFDYTSPVTKINVAVDKVPNFIARPNRSRNEVGEQHKGTIHLNCEEIGFVHQAYLDAANGIPSRKPMIEMCIPSSVDRTLAPSGHHVISLFTQYTPYHLSGGRRWTDEDKNAYADNVFNTIEEYAPGFRDSVVGADILTPSDLEDVFGLTGGTSRVDPGESPVCFDSMEFLHAPILSKGSGKPITTAKCIFISFKNNIFHGAMSLDQLFLSRPTSVFSSHETPFKGLFLCGSSTHPGGGVMGAGGRLAAKAVLQNLNK